MISAAQTVLPWGFSFSSLPPLIFQFMKIGNVKTKWTYV